MDRPTNPPTGPPRRRVLLLAGAAIGLLVVLLFALVVAHPLMLARLQDRGERFSNPIRMVKDWLFPPPVFILQTGDLDGDVFLQVPEPPAPPAPMGPPDHE